MTITAFTNEVGYFEKTDVVKQTRTGYTYDPFRVINDTEWVPITVASSTKSETIHSDHRGATPYFRHVVSLLEDIPYTFRHRFVASGKVQWDLKWTDYLSTKYPIVHMALPFQFITDLDNARDHALTDARSRLRDSKTRASLGAAAATAHQTAHEIATNSINILNAYRALRRGQFGQAAAAVGLSKRDVVTGGSFANAWLQWIYGIKPNLKDIHDACERLAHGYRNVGFDIHVSSNKHVSYSDPPGTGDFESEGRWNCKGHVRCAYSARISNGYLDSLDSSGVLNPLSIAWEAEPYSFIIDWFVPVGNVLESLTATAGLDFVGGYEFRREESTFTSRRTSVREPFSLEEHGSLKIGYFSFQRRILTNFEFPQFYAADNPFSSIHIANAVALIRNMAGNGLRLR
jgi:hypothetical protein